MESAELDKRLTVMWKQVFKDMVSMNPSFKGAKFTSAGEDGFTLHIEDPIPLVQAPRAHYVFTPIMGSPLREGILGLSCVLNVSPSVPPIKCQPTIALTKIRPGFTSFDPEALRALMASKFKEADGSLYEGKSSPTLKYAMVM